MSGAGRFNVLMCGRRFGKTALGLDVACEAALEGKRVGWMAPTYKVLNPAWDEMVGMVKGMPGFKKSEQDRVIWLPGGGSIECWSLDTPDPARSRKYHLVVIDEAGLVPNLASLWNAAIRPTLADYAGDAWFLGTPKGVGDFSRLWNLGQDVENSEWHSWRMPTSANPFIPAGEIEAMRLSLPEDVFRQEILGEPLEDGEHPIGLTHIASCVANLSEAEPVVWGVDLARAVDYTVAVAIDAGGWVCRLERWKTPWATTKTRLRSILGQTVTYMDSTGVGDPIVEDLQRTGSRVVGSMFTAKSKQQWVEGLIAAIQQHYIRFPDGWLRTELDNLTAERVGNGTRYAAPEGGDFHDDGVMALALAWQGFKDMGYPKERKLDDGFKLPGRARKLDVENGRAVRAPKQPTTVEELDAWLQRGREGQRLQHRERLPIRRYR